ncbi:MAG: HEPN domain-containing protein [Prevotellaceae bacterium]|jgi:HEPN domain-containing protein|nr:HEPN domain-containing protein [Prevotellaceae bacterium]
MEKQLKYEEWFLQSDYDLEVADSMLQTGRNIYSIFMCHLSVEKALKGLYIKRLNKIPPKIHNLMYFVGKTALDVPDEANVFLAWINELSITTRYPEDLRKMIALYTKKQTADIYQQTKSVPQWIKDQ